MDYKTEDAIMSVHALLLNMDTRLIQACCSGKLSVGINEELQKKCDIIKEVLNRLL